MLTNITKTSSAQQGVCGGVRNDICIAMTYECSLARKCDATKN
jgi:hypothetical protein